MLLKRELFALAGQAFELVFMVIQLIQLREGNAPWTAMHHCMVRYGSRMENGAGAGEPATPVGASATVAPALA